MVMTLGTSSMPTVAGGEKAEWQHYFPFYGDIPGSAGQASVLADEALLQPEQNESVVSIVHKRASSGRRRQGQHHEQHEEWCHEWLGAVPVASVVIDQRGMIRNINTLAEQLLPSIKKGGAWIEVIDREFLPRDDDGFEVSLRGGRLVSVRTAAIPETGGQIIMLHDMTEARMVQNAIASKQVRRAVEELSGTIAHQLRTPIASALLYCGALKEKLGRKPAAEAVDNPGLVERYVVESDLVDRVMKTLNGMENRIRTMLVFARNEISPEISCNSHDVLKATCERYSARLAEHKIHFEIYDSHGEVAGHEGLLVEAMSVLMENAIDAVAQKSVAVRTEIRPEVRIGAFRKKGKMVFYVEDNGPGFSGNILSGNARRPLTEKKTGNGIGLPLASRIARLHRGDMALENISEGGARVSLFIPSVVMKSGVLQ